MPALQSEPDPTREEPVPQIQFEFTVRRSPFTVRRARFAVRGLKSGVPERSPLRAAYQNFFPLFPLCPLRLCGESPFGGLEFGVRGSKFTVRNGPKNVRDKTNKNVNGTIYG
jgi:hypothetical protein